MTLAELITALEAADPNQVVAHGFTNPHSYRGDYMDLAFEPATDVTVADMLADARSALGATFEGYKGGDFTMSEHTWCWLSLEGDASGETISTLLVQLMLAAASAVVSPPPATRADVLREAADVLDAVAGQHPEARAVVIHWGDAAALLRTMAQEECDELEAQAHLDQLADELPYTADEEQQQPAVGPSRVADEEQPATEAPESDRIVAYRGLGGNDLHCLGCTPSTPGDIWTPVTSEELEHGGLCAICDVDVLIEPPR